MAADGALALPPAPQPARPRVLLVGTSLAASACFMAIVGLVGIYLATRAAVVTCRSRPSHAPVRSWVTA